MATRFEQQLQGEEAAVIDGDAGFIGVNTRLSPELLPAGVAAWAENVEFIDGEATTRRGAVSPAWLRLGAELFGVAQMRHPSTRTEGVIAITATGALWCEEGCDPVSVATPGTVAQRVRFTQEFDRIVAYRDGLEPWVWDGTTGFIVLDRTDANDGTRPCPLASHAEILNDRVLIPADEDNLDIGDIGELGKFGITNRVRLDTGRADAITRVFPFTQAAALVFKGRSTFLVSGISGALAGLSVSVVNADMGCVASEAVCSTGGDVLFLSGTGVYRVRQVVQERIETAAVAVSYDIEPTLRRVVNWAFIAQAQAAVWGDRYFLAVPTEGATENNAVFVFNLVTNQWEGMHTFPFPIDALFLATWRGERRLFAADFTAGNCYGLYEGEEDLTPAAADITGTLTTRGYLAGHATRKRWSAAQLATSEWHGQTAVRVNVDGNAETQPLYPVTLTRDRTACIVAGKRWTSTNANNDHGDSGRADYAVILNPAMTLGTGIVLNRRQNFSNRFAMQETGRFCQLTFTSSRGTAKLKSVQVEGATVERAFLPTT